jgi:hypothetical protein
MWYSMHFVAIIKMCYISFEKKLEDLFMPKNNFFLFLFSFSMMYTSCKFISCKKLLYHVRLLPHGCPHFSSPRSLRSYPCPS